MASKKKIPKEFDIESYQYSLDESLIAQKPVPNRTGSRLLMLDRKSGDIAEAMFSEILDNLSESDLLVFNNTKVIPARLHGRKQTTDAKIEVMLTKALGNCLWECLSKPAKRAKAGSIIEFSGEAGNVVLSCEVVEEHDAGVRIIRFDDDENLMDKLNEIGHIPLPPYINRADNNDDRERYQTVYASQIGAVAAPTAGLHFDDELLAKLRQKGIKFAEVTLHIGIGTFRPIEVQDIREHRMHSEYYTITQGTANIINQHKAQGGRIIAVGTTAVRTLETSGYPVKAGEGETDIFIYPPYNFQVIDAMITNFHLPASSLIVMVSAFAGRENILNAYNYAVKNRFRLFSYGDSMFIV